MSSPDPRSSRPLGPLELISEVDRVDRATAAMDAVINLVGSAVRALQSGDQARAEVLLDRAAGIIAADDAPEDAAAMVAEAKAAVARMRALAADTAE